MVSDTNDPLNGKASVPQVKITYQSKRAKIIEEKERQQKQAQHDTSDIVTDDSISSFFEPKSTAISTSTQILDNSPQNLKTQPITQKRKPPTNLEHFITSKKEKRIVPQTNDAKRLKNSVCPPPKESSTQWFLALGQKNFAAQCPDCGMSYSRGRADDERVHLAFHESIVNGISLNNYRSEVLIQKIENVTMKSATLAKICSKEFGSLKPCGPIKEKCSDLLEGSIVLYHGDRLGTYDRRKIEEICSLVNQSLGSSEIEEKRFNVSKVYLYLSSKRKVIGCLIAESIRQAYLLKNTIPEDKNSNPEDCWTLSSKPQSAIVGVNRLWVLPQFRRKGVASRLLKALQTTFLYGVPLIDASRIAFSQPTTAGRMTALSFSKNSGVLVYTEEDLVEK